MRIHSLHKPYLRTIAFAALRWSGMLFVHLCLPLLTTAEAAQPVAHNPDKLPAVGELPGWQMQGAPYAYDAATLYQYIDGAADQFILYGFQKLQGAEFINTTDAQETLIVDVYDMGSDLSAFGIFQSKKDPTSTVLKIGTEAFGNDQYLVFYQDRFYVEIQARIRSEKNRSTPQHAARLVAQKISGSQQRPALVRIFPEANKIPGSEQYLVGGILGHAFLPRGVVSDYRIAGETVKSFIMPFPSASAAKTAFDRYQQFIKAQGRIVEMGHAVGEDNFSGQEPYHKTVVVSRQGCFVMAITELSRPEQGIPLLSMIIQNVKNLKESQQIQ